EHYAFPIDSDFMPFRGGCGCSAEISAGWTRNLLLLPDRLSEARSGANIPPQDQDRWMLTPHPALDGDWPSLAMQKGNEEAVYARGEAPVEARAREGWRVAVGGSDE